MSAQVTITQLPQAGAITGSELVPIVQNGVTVQTTTGAIAGSPTQTYTYLTVNQTPQLANSRYVGVTNGLVITDGGFQGLFNISTTGALLSLVNSGTGFQVKTSATAITPRSIAVSGTGLSISNGSGVSGDPTISLTGQILNFGNASFNGLVVLSTAGAITSATITGTSSQIAVTNGNGISGNPTVGLADNAVMPGTGSMTIPSGTTGQQPVSSVGGMIRFDTTQNAFYGYSNGAWNLFSLTGSTFSAGSTGFTPNTATTGAVTLGGILNASNGGTGAATLTGYVYGNGTGVMTASTTIPNAGLANSSVTYNGIAVALGASGTITAANPNALTIGTGLSGTSYTGAAAVTIAIDSTVATLTGTQTLTNKTISGSSNTLTNIANASLTNSTISGVALGSNLNALTIGTGLSGTSYNGSSAVTIAIDSTVATLTGTQTLQNKTLNSTNTITALDTQFTLQDDVDPTKQAQFQLSAITTATTGTYTLPAASATLAGLGTAQTFTATNTFSNTATFSGNVSMTSSAFTRTATTQAWLDGSMTTAAWTVGGTAQTGIITLGRSTAAQTLNIATGATATATTKTLNIGTAGLSGSTTAISIGSAVSGATTTVSAYGAWTFNSTISATTVTATTGIFGGTF